MKLLLKTTLCLVVLFGLAGLVLAQDVPAPVTSHQPNGTTVVHNGDTFPSALGYAALALAGTVWGGMCAVVLHLWNRLGSEAKAHSEAMEAKDKAHAVALADKDRELRDVQDARRVEAERLLREQKDIFAEVMVTTAKLGTAFDESRMAIGRLQETTESLTEYVEQLYDQQKE